MDYVRLGKSELVSSVIGLGGGSSGRFGLVKGGTRIDAIRLIRGAVDQGITLFDGAGVSGGVDELMADALDGCRDDVLISTKVHLGPEPVPMGRRKLAHRASSWLARRAGLVCSAATLRRRVEQTLKTLRTDHIDVLHLHAVSPRQYRRVARVVPELVQMKHEGKLRAIGITEGFVSDPSHAMLSQAVRAACFDTIMVGFNACNPSAAEIVLPVADENDIGVLGMFAMRGLRNWRADDAVIREAGISGLAELAYRYARHQKGIDVVLTGTGDPRHLAQNIASALKPPLPPEVLCRLEQMPAGQRAEVSTR